MAKDLRQFLDQLEREAPHEVIRVKKPVNPAAFELTALLVHLEREGKFPVLLLEQPLNLKSERAANASDAMVCTPPGIAPARATSPTMTVTALRNNVM